MRVYAQCRRIKDLSHARVELQNWFETKEFLWQQRSKVLLLRDGNQNTKFFHSKTSQRNKKKKIIRIKNSEGSWQMNEDWDKVKQTILCPFLLAQH